MVQFFLVQFGSVYGYNSVNHIFAHSYLAAHPILYLRAFYYPNFKSIEMYK